MEEIFRLDVTNICIDFRIPKSKNIAKRVLVGWEEKERPGKLFLKTIMRF